MEEKGRGQWAFLHESIVNGDDKDLSGVLNLGVGNVAGDVGIGAGRA
jgi:hypothetical protein